MSITRFPPKVESRVCLKLTIENGHDQHAQVYTIDEWYETSPLRTCHVLSTSDLMLVSHHLNQHLRLFHGPPILDQKCRPRRIPNQGFGDHPRLFP